MKPRNADNRAAIMQSTIIDFSAYVLPDTIIPFLRCLRSTDSIVERLSSVSGL